MEYRFLPEEKDPVIDVIRTAIQRASIPIEKLARDSGVAKTTIYGWLYGKTRRPQRLTVEFVCRELGIDVSPRWVDSGAPARADKRVLGSFWRNYQARKALRLRRKAA